VAETLRFRTFAGVTRPIVLTILGAMLYLREGWLVGNAGLFGAFAVIGSAFLVTGLTSLSLSSLATNIRVRPGGAFAIISQALGLEAGGAIGIPLFLAQALSAAMYLYAFSEAWGFLFPSHDPRIIVLIGFALVLGVAWRSAGLAFKAQAVLSAVVVVALLSAAGGLFTAEELHRPQLIGSFEETNLLGAFSIFFPAATGIMVGVGMSGSLLDPRKSIPVGTLTAWSSTLVVYLLGAVWYAVIAAPDDLVADKLVMIDRAALGPLVLAGLLCSTSLAALSSLVAAPQLLQAMAAHGVVPGSAWLAKVDEDGSPRRATMATGAVALLGLSAGSLDAIAPIITSFFIMTYLAVNGVVYLEKALGMVSFRPTFSVSRMVPLAGVGVCLLGLALGSPFGGVVEVAIVLAIYFMLARRRLQTPWETVRSGVAVAVASWAARRAAGFERPEKAWKPDLLVPATSLDEVRRLLPVCEAICQGTGSIKLVGVGDDPSLERWLPPITAGLLDRQVYTTWTVLHTEDARASTGIAIDALLGAFFPPNLVVVDGERATDEELNALLARCRRRGVGLLVYLAHPVRSLGLRKQVAVWLSDRAPEWELALHVANLDLPVLIGLLLGRGLDARLCLLTALRDPASRQGAMAFQHRLQQQARLPSNTEKVVLDGPFEAAMAAAPPADVHVLGMPPVLVGAKLVEQRDRLGAATIFLLDSGQESALA